MIRYSKPLKLKLFLLMFVCIALVASACQNKNGGAAASGGNDTLIIGMSAANIPVPDTMPTEGYEGMRFVGFQIYDALVKWDLTQGEKPAELAPGLAESWEHSESDPNLWTFHLRQGVSFHDGTPFNADAVVFALDRIMKPDSEYYNAQMAGSTGSSLRYIAEYAKVDDYTLTMTTTEPYSFLLYDLASVLIASPEAIKSGGDTYTNHPVGTGPFKFVSQKLGQEMVMEKNEDYWGNVPQLGKIVLRPISDPSARLAALQSGEVNWVEIPPTESIELLKKDGYQVLTNPYPHIWPYVLNTSSGPWSNKLVRQAANYAIDREGMSNDLLSGAAIPSTQLMYERHVWYNDEAEPYSYDPEKAKQLLAEAGYPDGFSTTFMVPTSGSGNMWPIQMNEYVQKNLKAVGIDVKLESIEWQSLLTQYLQGFPTDKELGAINISLPTIAPNTFTNFFSKAAQFPNGINIGGYSNPELDALLSKASASFDQAEQDQLLKEASAIIADDAPWLFVVHDLNLRALSPSIKGFVQPQSWFADLTTISIE
ncbi:ABC transporter substrate-binding protein [Paenibacillus sp. HB172176]|uniref:ABC transporter substrate-binding protein n=1 Tax=Paenibacillus sp. HB172176 TaxID=2493690 RepID=UPI00143C8CFD|nr:ABC transporter substrate-binding protein [Paenibacillus sp. HB172176]